ncbi:MAG: carbon storage regulator CsrA [Myxococcota bacterium]|nr:carbon storage regulator CsrA [Myxococcota bacterium]
MLVLTRKPGEALLIGQGIRLQVVSVSRHKVRLAIEAPDDVAIHREEVFERIAGANRDAAAGSQVVELPLIERPVEPQEVGS